MGEIGAKRCGRDCALDGVAVHTSHLLEQSTTLLRAFTRGRRSGSNLCLLPFLKFLLRLGDEQKVHPGVLCPAKFGTKTEKGPRLIGLDPEMIRMPRHSCNFSGQLWHPELVEDIHGIQSQRKRFAYWDMNLIRY